MNMLNNLLFSNPALMNIWMFLTDASKKKSTGILESVVTVAGAIVAILMVIMIVKSVLEYTKGSGTGGIGKIVGQVIFFLIALVLILFARNYSAWQNVGEGIVNNVTCIVQETIG